MTHVTLEFHRVHQKQFPSLQYVWSKPYTYLALRLALSPNGPNMLPLEPRHLGVPSGVSKTIFELWYIWHKSCTYLIPTVTLSPNGAK
jgi:hypothetical protein